MQARRLVRNASAAAGRIVRLPISYRVKSRPVRFGNVGINVEKSRVVR